MAIKTATPHLKNMRPPIAIYKAVVEISPDIIIITDAEGKILDVNRIGIELFEHKTKTSFLKIQSFAELFENKNDFNRFARLIVSRKGFIDTFETRMQGKQGTVFDALIKTDAIADPDGMFSGSAVFIRNITKRQQALRQAERRNVRLAMLNAVSMTVSSSLDLNEVLHSTVDKIIEILEPDSVRIYLLEEKTDMLCLATHKGHSDNFINQTHMKHREVGIGLLGKTVLNGKARIVNNFLRAEDPFIASFLEEGLQSSAYIPLVSKGKPVGVMCVSNRSEFKFSNEYTNFLMAIGTQIGLAVDHANLYEDIKKAYKDLKLAQEQIVRSEKMASLGKLAATIAHEINNPLAAILNYIKLIKKIITKGRFLPERMPDINRFLNIMDTETVRCGEIVKSLLAFSRDSDIEMKTYSLEEIIDRTLNIIDHDLKIRKIRLIKKIKPDLPQIKCAVKQIQQALLNIMSNASEAIAENGIITVSAKRLKNSGFLNIAIADTGCGILKEDVTNIFEPFFTTKEEGQGVGLGLSVVYGIIKRHHGSVTVKSDPGKGSVFRIQLPIA